MSFNLFVLFFVTVFVASIIPGPSMLLALTHGMRYGAKRTLSSAMGNVTVTLIQALISLAGLGTILFTSEIIFQLIKWVGAGYLIFMGISILCSAKMSLSDIELKKYSRGNSLKNMYLQAAFVTAGNPKAIIFFTAIFPQFINPDAPYYSQFFILMSTCVLSAFFCFMFYAICGQKITSLFSKNTIVKYIQRIIGSTFIGAGIGLAASNK